MHGMSFGQDLPDAVLHVLTNEKIPEDKRSFLAKCIKNMVADFV
jgi:hypothetical protein